MPRPSVEDTRSIRFNGMAFLLRSFPMLPDIVMPLRKSPLLRLPMASVCFLLNKAVPFVLNAQDITIY